MYNGEMTINEAKVSMGAMWAKMENDEERLADIEVPSLTVQVMLSALCKDRVKTADYREHDRMSLFYVQRELDAAMTTGDLVSIATCRAEIEFLTMCIAEFSLRLEYDRAEMARINTALGARI